MTRASRQSISVWAESARGFCSTHDIFALDIGTQNTLLCEPSTLLIENIRKQIKQSIWWVMIITKQTIYMQIVCNGAAELDGDPSEGPDPE